MRADSAGARGTGLLLALALLANACASLTLPPGPMPHVKYGQSQLRWIDDELAAATLLEQAHHQAIHGGGNWKLGRTSSEILRTVAKRMQDYGIPMDFAPWRGP